MAYSRLARRLRTLGLDSFRDYLDQLESSDDPAEWEALLAASLDETEPPGDDDEEYLDPEGSILPPDEDLAAIEAEMARTAAERAADAEFLAGEDTAELAGRVAAGGEPVDAVVEAPRLGT